MVKKRVKSREQRGPPGRLRRRQDSDAKVEAAIEKLEEHSLTGKDSLAESEDRVPYGTSSEMLRKARVFADRYTRGEFDRLVENCRTHQMTLGRSLVDRSATIRDTRKRRGLETQVIQEG